jgi:A/G-specific adenine glycosylase
VKFTEPVIAAIGDRVVRETGVVAEVIDKLTEIRHSVTRYRITLACFHAEWKAGDSSGESKWVTRDELSDFPLSVTGRKIARLLQVKGDNTLF